MARHLLRERIQEETLLLVGRGGLFREGGQEGPISLVHLSSERMKHS